MNPLRWSILLILALSVRVTAQQSIGGLLDQDIVSLVATYKTLHAAPEL